jgi:hypothetical protein
LVKRLELRPQLLLLLWETLMVEEPAKHGWPAVWMQ